MSVGICPFCAPCLGMPSCRDSRAVVPILYVVAQSSTWELTASSWFCMLLKWMRKVVKGFLLDMQNSSSSLIFSGPANLSGKFARNCDSPRFSQDHPYCVGNLLWIWDFLPLLNAEARRKCKQRCLDLLSNMIWPRLSTPSTCQVEVDQFMKWWRWKRACNVSRVGIVNGDSFCKARSTLETNVVFSYC